MTFDEQAWREWSLAERERQYSPSTCVPAVTPYLQAYASRSLEAAQRFRCRKDLAWGKGPDETFDYFPADSADAPLLIFIHGGYWQDLSKNDSLFAAPDFVANGIAFAAIEYTLAPKASLSTIVDQCRRAIASLHQQAAALGFDPRQIYIAGSSAGAHLAAMMLAEGWQKTYGLPPDVVAGALLLSGVYDLEPLVGTYIDAPLHLSSAEVEALSPRRLNVGPGVRTIVAWGENETPEFKRQSRSFAAKLRDAGFPVNAFEVAGANHFDIVLGLTDRKTELGRATIELINTSDGARG
ncbi:MAG: alpha/beta hydrolase [Candidatus Acidiferrales bacterium]